MSQIQTVLRQAAVIVSCLSTATPVLAFDYNAYDHYSAANCVSTGRRVYCDIPTGSDGHITSQLTGGVVYLSPAIVSVYVCARHLDSMLVTCSRGKDGRARQPVVFETEELQAIRSLNPWWKHVLYLQLDYYHPQQKVSAMNSLNGYRVFWQIPE